MSTNVNVSNLNELDNSSIESFHSAESNDNNFYAENQCTESSEHMVHDCNSNRFVLSAGINIPNNIMLDINECEM